MIIKFWGYHTIDRKTQATEHPDYFCFSLSSLMSLSPPLKNISHPTTFSLTLHLLPNDPSLHIYSPLFLFFSFPILTVSLVLSLWPSLTRGPSPSSVFSPNQTPSSSVCPLLDFYTLPFSRGSPNHRMPTTSLLLSHRPDGPLACHPHLTTVILL
jgi:hypothetical protein